MTTEDEVHKAVWERFGAVDHAMLLLTSQFLSHLHAPPDNKSLYILEGEKLPECNAVKQLQLTSTTLSPLFASLPH